MGIIGVVSAITMPVLSANIQKNILKNQFRKTYSNIQNIINLITAEHGGDYECYYHYNRADTDSIYKTSECTGFWNDFFNKLNVISTCTGECIPDYKSVSEIIAEGGALGSFGGSCSFVDKTYIQNIKGYVLNDGSMLIKTSNLQLVIDVNGTKLPNKYGYDVFPINLVKNSKKPLELKDVWCTIKEKGGFFPSEILINK